MSRVDDIIMSHTYYNNSKLLGIDKNIVHFLCGCGENFSISKETVMRFVSDKKNKYYHYDMKNFGCQCKRKLPTSKYFSEAFLTNFKQRKNLDFNININYLDRIYEIQKGLCFYTGDQLILPNKDRFRTSKEYNVSIDRLDSNYGYIKGNCVLCTKDVNMFKFTTHNKRFWDICSKISEFN